MYDFDDYDEDRSNTLQAEYAKEREESEKKLGKFLSALSASEELRKELSDAVNKYVTATIDCSMAQRWTEGRIGGYQKVQYNTPERVKMQEAFEELRKKLSELLSETARSSEALKLFEDHANMRAYFESVLEYG